MYEEACRFEEKGERDTLPQENGFTDLADTLQESRDEGDHGIETVASPENLEEIGALFVGRGAGMLGVLDLDGPFFVHEVGDALDAVVF